MAENVEQLTNTLLEEFKEQREALKLMINDLEEVKKNVNNLFPEKMDKRFSGFFDEKIKAATGIFNSLLEIRKEITRSLKDEIEIRRKLNKEDKEETFNIENFLDIGKLASRIEKVQTKKENKIEEVNSLIESLDKT